MKTRVTELLGISYPIIQGGMAWVAEHHLAAAVSEAGVSPFSDLFSGDSPCLLGDHECGRPGYAHA